MISPYLKINQDEKDFKISLKSHSNCKNPGIYYLFYIKEGLPHHIHRLNGIDKSGILYIGMTEGDLFTRVANLQKALVVNSKKDNKAPKSTGHTQMGKKFFRIRNMLKLDHIFVQIHSKQNPKQAETDALEDYVNKYAELPPLNGQYGSYEPDWTMFS
jgi:hypothetical protein